MTVGRFTAPAPRRRVWASVFGRQACEDCGLDLTTERYATIAEQVRSFDELHIVGRAPFSLLDLPQGVTITSHARPKP